ncbi:MAG: hypothetical protein JO122_18420 [Acetobacteraceae bacterium]|nr:hypothetical protein [Acetobacteraceae bacterium]
MKQWVVDTNVPIVANGHSGSSHEKTPSVLCRLAAVKFLQNILYSDQVLLDLEGEIQAEYPRGQPGVGDRFYLEVLRSSPDRVLRVDLPRRDDGEYADLPQSPIDVGFDPSDRKFAALANRHGATVANATDSDWLDHHGVLMAERRTIHFVCGGDQARWFES